MSDSSGAAVVRLDMPRGKAGLPALGAAQAVLKDVLSAKPFDAAATAFVLACLPQDRKAPVLWVQDRASRLENGRIYAPALKGVTLLRVEVSHARDVLWAMEEGASCVGLSAVVGEVHGAPPVLDFTATKRLAMRSEASGVPIWLIRSGRAEGLSAARERWRIGTMPSDTHPHNAAAPGAPVWEAELFRARGRSPGIWAVRDDGGGAAGAHYLRFLSRSGDGPVEADHGRTAHAAG